MATDVPTIPAALRLSELAEQIARGDGALARFRALPIVDEAGRLAGIVSHSDVLRALENNTNGDRPVIEIGRRQLAITHPDEPLSEAAEKMLLNDVGRLLVVKREDPRQLVGYLGRAGIISARMRRLAEEHVREPGWFNWF
jgi:CBS domain-containing protein